MSNRTEVLEVRKRVAFFGEHSEYHVYVTKGKRGRFRWEAIGVDTGQVEFLSPVKGFGSFEDAEADVSRVLHNMSVSFREVPHADG